MPVRSFGASMRRREFILIAGAAAAWPMTLRAQQGARARTIGVIMNYAEGDPEGQARLSAFRDRLQQIGWTEGNNARIEVRWPAGKSDRMRADAAELIGLPADVIVANSTPLLAVLKPLTQTIPIVFAQVANPVESGFVDSFARPGGNITGFTDFDPTIAGKWIELLKEAAPLVGRVTVLMDPKQSNHTNFLDAIAAAARPRNIEVSPAAAGNREEIERTIGALAGQTDRGLIVLPGPVNNTARASIIREAARARLPAIYPFKYYGKDGGLLYYGIDQVDQWPRVAGYVDRILRGEQPRELPVQAPTRFELVINLKAAAAIGLTMPPTLMARADEVIE